MSDLNKLKKPKIRLLKATFDHEGAEVSYTTMEKGGAASLMNEAYMFKSMDSMTNESLESAEALDNGNTGVIQTADNLSKSNENNKVEETMTGMTKEQIDALIEENNNLKKKLTTEANMATLAKYELGEDLTKELAESDSLELVTKALDAMVVIKDEAIEEAKVPAAAVATDIAKALAEEAGHDDAPEAQINKTLAERMADARAQKESK